ncbi:SURF1 family cytochrome oxidase biogenesis protein [Gryllotalpicola protaetiae]|uniref:SURF1-like protein n=1 Tax=Gryllotalpicola protaetiae TaxID=2419771 RepID=A0A387BP77_9MICO|nr:SURF1 family cytochrome oxidase biogenesis protein [Gryllotalpicola protaetiae]AYG02929.1 SURF1 family protein [Gryllotalpicola protaetiae]
MRRPRWIGVLLIALAIAGGFAYLGKWQLTRAVEARQVGPQITETTHPLHDVLTPGKAIANDRVGQLVTVDATTVPADYVLIQDRDNNSGPRGWWVVAHAAVSDGPDAGAQLAVARGFTASRAVAIAMQQRLEASAPEDLSLTGRIQPTDPPEQPEDSLDGTPPMMRDLAVAILINHWTQLGDSPEFFEAYLVATNHVPDGLKPIYAPAPIQQRSIDWLNAFYAAEWAVFAGFAVYLWYRLTKDAWEREVEDMEAASEQASDHSDETQKVD